MGGDAFLFLFLFLFFLVFSNKQTAATGKDFDPAGYPNRFILFLFKDFFFLLRLDFVKEQLIETMLQHLCSGWNAHAKCTEFFVLFCS